MKDLEAALEAALRGAAPADSAHDIGHVRRVWRNAQDIARGEGVEPSRALMAAAYLHDLVSLPKDHPDRKQASRLSAALAAPILQGLGLGEDEVTDASHAITAHSFSAGIPPETTTARILQDADRIEALGAIGLARVFAVSGALGRPLFSPEDPFARNRPLDDATYAVDHFAAKLLRLPETMTTATGRTLAEARAGVLRRYLSDLASELGSELGSDPPGW